MMLKRQISHREPIWVSAGFTLTEMLVTMLIMVLASTLLATGVPVAIRTYHQVTNSANAQIALATTLSILRSELGTARDVRVCDNEMVLYKPDEGEEYWVVISNPTDDSKNRGLMKQYFKDENGDLEGAGTIVSRSVFERLTPVRDKNESLIRYPLIPDASVPEPLQLRWTSVEIESGDGPTSSVKIGKLYVYNENSLANDGVPGSTLAVVGDADTGPYQILTRFAK